MPQPVRPRLDLPWPHPDERGYRVGDRVVATTRIVENDLDPDPNAGPCEPGWTHCELGDLGEVVEADMPDQPTVTFLRQGTATLVSPSEIRPVGPGDMLFDDPSTWPDAD